jgi:Methyl-accepting chemotaxis protein-like, first PDC sensor domain
MTTHFFRTLSAIFMLIFAATSYAEKAPDAVNDIVPELQSWGKNATLIAAVQAQNSKGMSLDDIKARDAEWRKVDGMDAEMTAIMESAAAKELAKLEKTQPYFFEVFLMDNQGANVAMTNKTSDYWQGDEAKWQESFKGGAGAVHIGDVEFDESAQAYLVQVSVPVMDGGSAIGAITIGINLDDLEAQ